MIAFKPRDVRIDREQWIWFGTLIVLTVGIYWVLVQPRTRALSAVRSQYRAAREQQETRAVRAQDLVVLEREIDELTRKWDSVKGRVLPTDGVTDFLNGLTSLAEGEGCRVETIDMAHWEGGEGEGFQEREVQLHLFGSFQGLTSFIKKLEEQEQRVYVERVTLNSGDEEDVLSLALALKFIVSQEGNMAGVAQ